jgi:hypothetical protein
LRVGWIANVLDLHDRHDRGDQRDRGQDPETCQHRVDGDPDAEGIERTPIQRERREQAEERHVTGPRARRDRRNQRRERGLDARQAGRDQQHADTHEEDHRRSDVFGAANRGRRERRDRLTRIRRERPIQRGQREGDQRVESREKIERDR